MFLFTFGYKYLNGLFWAKSRNMRKCLIRLVLLVCLCLHSSCFKERNDKIVDGFSSNRGDYKGNQIRFDGYYYNVEYNADGTSWINAKFFYRNGIILRTDPYPLKDSASMLNEFKEGTFINKAKGSSEYWGQFYISQGSLTYEVPGAPTFAGGRYVFSHFGRIENDTSLVFYFTQRVNGANQATINEVYKFKHFSPKPDSVNKYIN